MKANKMIVMKRIMILLFFFSNGAFSAFYTKYSYEKLSKNREGFKEVVLFEWPSRELPLKVCVDSNLPSGWFEVIKKAADMWEIAVKKFYRKYIHPYTDQEGNKYFSSVFFNLFNVYSNCRGRGIEPDVYVSRNRLNRADYTHSLFYASNKKRVGVTNYKELFDWLRLSYNIDYMIIDFDKETPFSTSLGPWHNREQLLINTAMHELGHAIGIAHTKERKLMHYHNTYCLGKTCPPTERNIYDFLTS